MEKDKEESIFHCYSFNLRHFLQSQGFSFLKKRKNIRNNLTYYDVHFILTYSGEEENENFPLFGAKSSNSLKVVW